MKDLAVLNKSQKLPTEVICRRSNGDYCDSTSIHVRNHGDGPIHNVVSRTRHGRVPRCRGCCARKALCHDCGRGSAHGRWARRALSRGCVLACTRRDVPDTHVRGYVTAADENATSAPPGHVREETAIDARDCPMTYNSRQVSLACSIAICEYENS